jgi:tetratricopeptide (TPR) repeat protein
MTLPAKEDVQPKPNEQSFSKSAMTLPAKEDVQPKPNEQSFSKSAWNISRSVISVVFIIMALIVVGLAFGIPATGTQPALLLVFTLAVYFPFTYLAYWAVRTEMRRKRLEEDLVLLGYPKEEATRLYEQVHDQMSYFLFITLSVLTTIIGTTLLFWSPAQDFMSAGTVQAIRYGFFGSYLFSAFLVYRRFSTNDLHPTVYLYCAFTMIAGLVFNYIAVEALTSISGSADEAEGVAGGMLAIVAFALGYFPYLAVRWFNRLAFTSLNIDKRRTELLPLSLIDGISDWHETRLRDTGIDDIQNLASAEIRELLVNTAFNVQEVIEWIDQATLYLYLESPEIQIFRQAKIRMTSDFCAAWEACGNDDEKKDDFGRNLQITKERLQVLHSSLVEGPNVHRVRNYWTRARFRVDEILNIKEVAIQLDKLAVVSNRFDGVLLPLASDVQAQLMGEYGALLNRLLPNPSIEDIFNFGKLYLSLGDYDKAIENFDSVIKKINQPTITDELHFMAYHSRIFTNAYKQNMDAALADCDILIEKTAQDKQRHTQAYNIKCEICEHFKQDQQLIATIEKAITVDPQYADNHNRLAWHYATHEPYTPEKLLRTLEIAEKAVELAQNTDEYANCLDTLAYVQLMYAKVVVTTEEAKEEWYNRAYETLQAALKSPSIDDYSYPAVSDRLRDIVLYWQSIHTPQAIEYEVEALLTALTIPTLDLMIKSDIKSRLKELGSYGTANAGQNGAAPYEAALSVINDTRPALEIPSEIVDAPAEPPTLPNPTIPQ